MPEAPQRVNKPERWGVPFDANMTEADVDRLLTLSPFREMDPAGFPARIPLRGLLQYDCGIRRYRLGEIIVRQGDYGTSAFVVLSGEVQVVKTPNLPASILGRPEARKRNFLGIVAQLWSSTRRPESGLYSQAGKNMAFGIESDESGRSRFILQDIP